MKRALHRATGAAALAAMALAFAPASGMAQRLDVRKDPSICSTALSSSCLDSLGAGAMEAPGSAKPGSRACAEQLAVYSACIGYASGAKPARGGAAQSGGGGGTLPITATGVLTPKKRNVYPFSHSGGRVQVVASEFSQTANVSLRTSKGVELIRRTSKLRGGERSFDQCLPPGDYQLSVQGRSRGTPYKVVVTAIGEC